MRSANPWILIVMLAVQAVGLAGCDGSGGSGVGAPSGSPPQTTGQQPTGRGTLIVDVADALGQPMAGATVRVYTPRSEEDRQGVADGSGRAEFTGVIAGRLSVAAVGIESYGFLPDTTLAGDSVLRLTLIALPSGASAGGIARVTIPSGGLSADRSTLEFTLDIVQVASDDAGEYWAWGTDAVRIVACTPDPTNDLPRFQPDCVSGTGDFDSAYTGSQNGSALSLSRIEVQDRVDLGRPSYSAALLIDQSDPVIHGDPGDRRLFAAKYFLGLRAPESLVALAVFAVDDRSGNRFSPLPQQPLSFLPLENPQFTADGRSLFATVDQLGTLEGGATPLYSAVERALDFVAAGPRRDVNAVVIVTNGVDDTCGSRVECRELRDAVVMKSRATGIRIVSIGLGKAAPVDHEALAILAQGADGSAAFWIDDSSQLAMTLGNTSEYLADSKDRLRATFRIQSERVGAFERGRTVLGQVRLEVCPWDCNYTYIPFAIQIP